MFGLTLTMLRCEPPVSGKAAHLNPGNIGARSCIRSFDVIQVPLPSLGVTW